MNCEIASSRFGRTRNDDYQLTSLRGVKQRSNLTFPMRIGKAEGRKRIFASKKCTLKKERKMDDLFMEIEVVKIPAGPAPIGVRERWVGATLYAIDEIFVCSIERNPLTGEIMPTRPCVWVRKKMR